MANGKEAQKDNSTYWKKVSLRTQALKHVSTPIVMETHGGAGKLFERCYATFDQGVVFEKDPNKTKILAQQRPTWSVYECDCVGALAAGAGFHLPVNFLDVDPYGEPWPVLEAFFGSDRPFPKELHIVVNDGLRQKLATGGAWSCKSLAPVVEEFGNDLHSYYLDVCQILMATVAEKRGYSLTEFAGYYCGHALAMTHYWAILKR